MKSNQNQQKTSRQRLPLGPSLAQGHFWYAPGYASGMLLGYASGRWTNCQQKVHTDINKYVQILINMNKYQQKQGKATESKEKQ